jgi:phage-related baseplate assembly protein
MQTVSQLLRTLTSDEALQTMIFPILTSLKFPATSWHSGGIARTLIELLAKLVSEYTATRQVLTASRYNRSAIGDWLTLLSSSHFSNDRYPATFTVIDQPLTTAIGAGPYTVAAGDSILIDADGRPFRNMAGFTLTTNTTQVVRYRAEFAGVIPLPTAPSLQTPLAGVSLGLPTLFLQGTSEESDDRLRTRNESRWGTLGYASPTDAYRLWALQAVPAVTRVRVDDNNPGGPGTVYVYIAGISELVGTEAVDVKNYIEGTDGIGRRPIGSNVSVFNATHQNVTLSGTVYYDPTYASVQVYVEQAIRDYFDAVGIGGSNGVVPLAGIYRAIMSVPGVVNMALTAPVSDVAIPLTKFPEEVLSFVYSPI